MGRVPYGVKSQRATGVNVFLYIVNIGAGLCRETEFRQSVIVDGAIRLQRFHFERQGDRREQGKDLYSSDAVLEVPFAGVRQQSESIRAVQSPDEGKRGIDG